MNVTFPQAKLQDLNNFSIKKSNRFKKQNSNNFSSYDNAIANYSKAMISFRGESFYGICPNDIKKYIKNNPNASLVETAKHFNLNLRGFQRVCAETGFDYGKEKSKILKTIKIENKASKLPPEKEFMDFYNSGETRPKYIAKHFGISIAQVREYLRKYCSYESARPEKVPYNAKLNIQELKEFIENNPQLTYSEIAQHFGVVSSSVYRAIMLNDIDYIPKESSLKSHKIS